MENNNCSNTKIKWGVIGCGGIAKKQGIRGILLCDNTELIAVMDINGDVANQVKEEFGAKYAFDNIEDLLKVDEIQAVYIASPVVCHKEHAIAAAKAKKHILLEKPVARTIAEAQEISVSCKEAGVKAGIGLMMRFHSYNQKMHELIADGAIGEVVSARIQATGWYPPKENAWAQKKALAGGGVAMDMGIHAIDLLRYIIGQEVVDAVGMAGNQIFDYEVEDAASVLVRLENGAMCHVDTNWNLPCVLPPVIEIHGTKGSLIANGTLGQGEGGTLRLLTSNGIECKETEIVLPLKNNLYKKEFEAFGYALSNDTELPISIDDAIRSQMIIEAIYETNASRRVKELK